MNARSLDLKDAASKAEIWGDLWLFFGGTGRRSHPRYCPDMATAKVVKA
ncbi:hypothetical protein [Microcoleus sp. herbarium12]